MHISDIGEFGLIKRFQKKISINSSVVKGSGDDCAVLKFNQSSYQLFTCDMIVEGVDFFKNANLRLVGQKALAISISDIAACGGIPKHAVVALGLSRHMQIHQIDCLAKGLFDLAGKFNVNIVGGDISSSSKLIIDVSMLGVVEKDKLCLRSGARSGDLIMVTGEFGGSIKGKHLKFTPRLKEAQFLVNNFKINAMIDVSDGLVQDLGHILELSSVGAVLYESLIPLSKQARGTEEALCSGEEFELLFTAPRDQASKIIKSSKYRFKLIGEIMPESFGLRLINYKNKYSKLKFQGYSAEARTGRSYLAGYRHF